MTFCENLRNLRIMEVIKIIRVRPAIKPLYRRADNRNNQKLSG